LSPTSTIPSRIDMVNWQSPFELAKDEQVYDDLVFAFFGVMFWEIFQTSGVEWQFLRRRKELTWPMV